MKPSGQSDPPRPCHSRPSYFASLRCAASTSAAVLVLGGCGESTSIAPQPINLAQPVRSYRRARVDTLPSYTWLTARTLCIQNAAAGWVAETDRSHASSVLVGLNALTKKYGNPRSVRPFYYQAGRGALARGLLLLWSPASWQINSPTQGRWRIVTTGLSGRPLHEYAGGGHAACCALAAGGWLALITTGPGWLPTTMARISDASGTVRVLRNAAGCGPSDLLFPAAAGPAAAGVIATAAQIGTSCIKKLTVRGSKLVATSEQRMAVPPGPGCTELDVSPQADAAVGMQVVTINGEAGQCLEVETVYVTTVNRPVTRPVYREVRLISHDNAAWNGPCGNVQWMPAGDAISFIAAHQIWDYSIRGHLSIGRQPEVR